MAQDRGLTSVGEYLSHAANARVIYVALWEAALSTLPPNIVGEHNVECHYTAKDLAARFPGRSVSIVKNELQWLKNWRWMDDRKQSVRFLGRRIDGVFYLLSDVAARTATGEERLISHKILGIELPDLPSVTEEAVKRGTMRKWQGTETGGTTFDLGS